MAKEVVDTRKLKDEAAEYLKKSKFEKAADTLEKLVKVEPKDMTHRLRLGDTYRRLNEPEKAIASYQQVARFYGDEGQLIKAIGAVKIILEIDPKNSAAQQQLSEMNTRRFGKPMRADAGVKKPARAPAAPGEEAVAAVAGTMHELPPDG